MPSVQLCSECGGEIIVCDNSVHLDYPAVPYDAVEAPWTLMSLGALTVAAAGNPSPQGTGHALHAHQPPELT